MLFKCENISVPAAIKKLKTLTKNNYSHDEVYGDFCNVIQYINCPLKKAFNYLVDIFNMEEWTFSIRNFKKLNNNLYVANDTLVEDTQLYFRIQVNKQAYTIEHHCAWDQSKNLWMRYYFHLLDAMPALKKPGVILLWLNCKHPYYYLHDAKKLPNYIVKSQRQPGRVWIGEYWQYFPAAHKLEANNLKLILEQKTSKK